METNIHHRAMIADAINRIGNKTMEGFEAIVWASWAKQPEGKDRLWTNFNFTFERAGLIALGEEIDEAFCGNFDPGMACRAVAKVNEKGLVTWADAEEDSK